MRDKTKKDISSLCLCVSVVKPSSSLFRIFSHYVTMYPMHRPLFRFSLCLLSIIILISCTEVPMQTQPSPPDAGLDTINAENLAQHIQTLASDEFEGRLPGSKGEELTIEYLTDQFTQLGISPGNPSGSYLQAVPLVGITLTNQPHLTLSSASQTTTLDSSDQFVAWTKRVVEEASIEDSDLVFVGYGVVAPEFDWNDYKDLDVAGKTVIMLVNDPPVPDPNDPSTLDQNTFGGRAMTYYGRWTYKFEQAARMGAAGCLVIHETGPAGYPWEVVSGSWTGEQFDLVTPDKNLSRCAVEGWLTSEEATQLFARSGHEFESLKQSAVTRDFTPVPLNVKASLSLQNELRTIDSSNVLAKLEGSDPDLKDEYVIYMGHWDHLGKDENKDGDQIYNGAVDNATGIASLLELARAFARLETRPRRSLLFLATTAEESGLLGSRYYGENPLYPLARTLAAINMDAMNVLGPTQDITVVGLGNSTLDEILQEAAQIQGRTVRPDPELEKGFFYRSDHFSLAKQGIPSLYTDPGVDYIDKPEDWGLKLREEYTNNRYHKPADEYDPSWDLSGMVEDLRLLFRVGYQIANQDTYPEWKFGTEFRALREQQLNAGQ